MDSYAQASRFLAEIPAELIEEIRPQLGVSQPVFRRSDANGDESTSILRLGQRVKHGKFGEGVVLNCEGSGAHARVQVNFESEGTKWLVMSYANLELM